MSLKSLLAGAACLAAIAATAPVSAQPFAGPWSGFYIGGHLGAAFNANKLTFQDGSTDQDLLFHSNQNNNELLGGVQAGYDWQAGNLLLGVEGDVSFAKNIDYLSTARGRLGFPMGPFLLYGTGGVAFEGTKEQFDVLSTGNTTADAVSSDATTSGVLSHFSRSINKDGWVVGGGAETFVMPAVSVGVEGLWYNMGRDSNALDTPTAAGGEPFLVRDDRNFAVVRARLTYHLGW